MCDIKVRLQQLRVLEKWKLFNICELICLLSFVIVNLGNEPDVDDSKPPTKRLKVTKGIKVFPEQVPGRV